LQNAFSVDLEDWFCVQNLSAVIQRTQWEYCESRVEQNTLRLLDLFERRSVEATFFVLGWVAERHPDLVREIEHKGHEIATHGYSHTLLTQMTPDEFRADLDRSLEVLARCASTSVLGFRAPSFSVTRKTWWALDILRSRGLRYDSSVFPIGFHPDYGVADAPLDPYPAGGVLEIPMSCARLLGRKVPCCGGGYFRIYPYALTRRLINACNLQGRPVIFYLHPWEIDPDQPRVAGLTAFKRFRHYKNLERTMARLEKLLGDFRFTSIRTRFREDLTALSAAEELGSY
jgi:polysaccharide deacetylase family protein (PEP-CTERM system associated)